MNLRKLFAASVILLAAAGGGATTAQVATAAPTVSVSPVSEPVDCTPVGTEWVNGTLYYVENCHGYNVYRPL